MSKKTYIIRVAAYKNSKTQFAKLIRFKQYRLSDMPYRYAKYTHTELVFENGMWWSSSEYDKGVRFKEIVDDKGNWDYVDLKVSKAEYDKVYAWCEEQNTNRYNWFWIFFAQVLNTRWFVKVGDLFCSQWCTKALQQIKRLCGVDAIFVSPGELMYLLKNPHGQGY